MTRASARAPAAGTNNVDAASETATMKFCSTFVAQPRESRRRLVSAPLAHALVRRELAQELHFGRRRRRRAATLVGIHRLSASTAFSPSITTAAHVARVGAARRRRAVARAWPSRSARNIGTVVARARAAGPRAAAATIRGRGAVVAARHRPLARLPAWHGGEIPLMALPEDLSASGNQ